MSKGGNEIPEEPGKGGYANVALNSYIILHIKYSIPSRKLVTIP